MNSSSRTKLLAALLGIIFLGSVVFLLFEGKREEEVDAKIKETLGKPAPGKAKAPTEERPHCPECGKELPSSGECPFCLIKKKIKAGGKDEPTPVPRLGRYLAWSMVGVTIVLGVVHLGMFLRERRRFLGRGSDEPQLKTRCGYCKRRVRFAARLTDTYGSCPTCRQRIQFKPIIDPYG
jgi:DNA-directed RNA polymerase subunit RPC12/RpoP